MAKNNMLFKDVVGITSDYLGPSAERFVTRQIETHLEKDPSRLTQQDLNQLIDWLRVSLAFITDNEHIIDEYEKRLTGLLDHRSRRYSNADRKK